MAKKKAKPETASRLPPPTQGTVRQGHNVKCPHCLTDFRALWRSSPILWPRSEQLEDADGRWSLAATLCPACHRAWMILLVEKPDATREYRVWPEGVARNPLSKDVPERLAAEYHEARRVLTDSARASAALGRRCLQRLLREAAHVKPDNLSHEINQVLASRTLPTSLAEAIDAIRSIGNFGANPIKSTNPGAIVDVEPGEADWCLDVLESLFDFYFVQPAKLAAKKTALNQKLAEARTPPMR